MMATTIMISTSVKPLLLDTLFFILTLSFCCDGVNEATSGLIIIALIVHELLVATATGYLSKQGAKRQAAVWGGCFARKSARSPAQ
jgi:hypothetical protein